MTTHYFNLNKTHASWRGCLQQALATMDANYLAELTHSTQWLPGPDKIFNAFSLPLEQTQYVLFGESPYPRAESANGYAFWDEAVQELWSPTGLSKKVNRATSFRNLIKMLLVAEGLLDPTRCGQDEIATIDKKNLVKTNHEFFTNLQHHGFLLLNATLVLQSRSPQKDAKMWYPFMQEILNYLLKHRPHTTFILFGQIANTIDQLIKHQPSKTLYAEHPYNHSFITNPKVLAFFKPLHLLYPFKKDKVISSLKRATYAHTTG